MANTNYHPNRLLFRPDSAGKTMLWNSTDTEYHYNKNKSKIDSKNEVLNISFTVQVLVAKATVDTNLLSKFSQRGNVEKIAKGSDMYEYYAGTYSNYSDAQIQLSKAKKNRVL